MEKFINEVCKTCGAKFKSEVHYDKGRLCCYIDCPSCRKDKMRYLSSVNVYTGVYDNDSGEG